jgi:hypothetical protein
MDTSARAGCAKVSRLMASDNEFDIFLRFKMLCMRNLLYIQAEVTQPESELTDWRAEMRSTWTGSIFPGSGGRSAMAIPMSTRSSGKSSRRLRETGHL